MTIVKEFIFLFKGGINMENFKKVEGEDLEKVSGGVLYDEVIGPEEVIRPGRIVPPVIGLRDYIKKM